MRLRSIPPRTMASLAAQRPAAMLPGSVVLLQQHLLSLGGAHRGGRRPAAPDGGPGGSSGRHGSVYRRPGSGSTALPDILVRPRSGPDGGHPAHTVSETAEAQIVSIVFPLAVGPTEVRWELHGDVLEVEYVGAAFTYFHAFLVPADTEPDVQRSGRTLSFCFPKSR